VWLIVTASLGVLASLRGFALLRISFYPLYILRDVMVMESVTTKLGNPTGLAFCHFVDLHHKNVIELGFGLAQHLTFHLRCIGMTHGT